VGVDYALGERGHNKKEEKMARAKKQGLTCSKSKKTANVSKKNYEPLELELDDKALETLHIELTRYIERENKIESNGLLGSKSKNNKK